MKLTYGLLEELLREELDISRVKEELSDRIIEEIALYPGEDNKENKKEKILYLTDDIKVTGEKILLVTDKETDQWHVTVTGEKNAGSHQRDSVLVSTLCRMAAQMYHTGRSRA